MKKYSISINKNKISANEKGYADLEIVFNKEEKKKEGETWELWQLGFITTKAPKGQKGEIVGNVSEFRNKEKQDSFGDMADPDNIPF